MVNMEKFIIVQCTTCKGTGRQRVANPAYLRKRREDAGISLRGFSRRLKLSPSYLSDVELGRRPSTTEVVQAYEKLAKK